MFTRLDFGLHFGIKSTMALAQRHSAGTLHSHSSTVQGVKPRSGVLVLRQIRRQTVIRSSYETDTDTQPKAPNAPPGRWGSAPPPPPPPPPPPRQTTSGAPSRREAMFGLLGAALGVGVTTAYYKAQYPDDEESLAEALDALLDNPDFLDAVADELIYQEYEAEIDENNAALSRMRNALAAEMDGGAAAEGK